MQKRTAWLLVIVLVASFAALGASTLVNLATQATGVLPCASFPVLTGGTTTSSGSCAVTVNNVSGNTVAAPTQWGIAYASTSSNYTTTGALTANALVKAGSSAAPSASTVVDNGSFVTTTELIKGTANTCVAAVAGVAMTTTATPVTICSWTLPATAEPWAWQCTGAYTTTTSTDTFAVGWTIAQAPSTDVVGFAMIGSVSGSHTASVTQVWSSGSNTAATTTNNSMAFGPSVSSVTLAPWSSSGEIVNASGTSGTFVITGMLTGTTPSGHVFGVCTLA